jgi:syntaxin-binding protein 1
VDDFAGDPAARVASARTNRSGLSWARPGSSSVGAAGGGGGGGGGGAAAAAGGGSSMFGSVTNAMAGLGLGGAGTAAGPAAAGRRLVVFVVGGVTRGEMRAVAELSRRSGRDILLGSTSVLRPTAFLSQLRSIGPTP